MYINNFLVHAPDKIVSAYVSMIIAHGRYQFIFEV